MNTKFNVSDEALRWPRYCKNDVKLRHLLYVLVHIQFNRGKLGNVVLECPGACRL